VTAGTTRCAVSYWAAKEWPEFFMPIDKRDTRTRDAHRDNLERERRHLERGGTATRRVSDQRRAGVLPPSSGRVPAPAAPAQATRSGVAVTTSAAILADLLASTSEPEYWPLHFYVRRTAHRTYLRYIHGRRTCTWT
jgi:hypothetical protein